MGGVCYNWSCGNRSWGITTLNSVYLVISSIPVSNGGAYMSGISCISNRAVNIGI